MNPIFSYIIHGIILIGTAVFWELVAWFMHKYVMHGIGWFLHKDHHVTTGRRFQLNDLYAIFFAAISFSLIYGGLKNHNSYIAAAGFGVALYGIGYITFHDLMFHKRIKFLKISAPGKYLKNIISSHRIHHGTVTKYGATNFSFLWPAKDSSPHNDPQKD